MRHARRACERDSGGHGDDCALRPAAPAELSGLFLGIGRRAAGDSRDGAGRLQPIGRRSARGGCAESFPERAAQPVRQSAGAHSIDAWFDALESYLRQRLEGASLDTHVSAAIRILAESAGGFRIEEVARQCGTGRRQLERLMRTWVGLSPKRLARVARFQALLGSVAGGPAPHWTSMAAESYADQAHLIHEFSEFAGASPRRFPAEQSKGAWAARCG